MRAKINIEIIDNINTISDYTSYLNVTKEGLVDMYKVAYEQLIEETHSDLVDYIVSVEIEE